jgi:hypothetical protein
MYTKYIFNFILIAFASMVSIFTIVSCNKSDPYAGCRNNYKGTECSFTVNEGTAINFKADTTGCIYDSVAHRIFLYSADRLQGIEMQFNINAPMQNFSLPLTYKDSFGTGTVTAIYKGVSYGASYGNIGLNVNTADRTVCGQFFYNQNSTLLVSEGKFGVVRIYYK